jgi:hypothetical protein
VAKFNPDSPPLRKTTVMIRDEEHDITEVRAGVFEEALERLTGLVKEFVDLILYGSAIMGADLSEEKKQEAYESLKQFAIERVPELVKKCPKEMIEVLSILTGYSEDQIRKWPPDLIIERLVQEIVTNFHWIADDIKKKAAPLLKILGSEEKAQEEPKELSESPSQSLSNSP